jgi:hypothetical protein
MQKKSMSCEKDEWPPAAIWQGSDRNVWIRFSPREGNNAAEKHFISACPDHMSTDTVRAATFDHGQIGDNGKVSTRSRAAFTVHPRC